MRSKNILCLLPKTIIELLLVILLLSSNITLILGKGYKYKCKKIDDGTIWYGRDCFSTFQSCDNDRRGLDTGVFVSCPLRP
ncbi:hypothetical protein BCR32DRAFT_282586 [Anaeromyces robustus]|uniref:Uncharacterized protein n=1 Tax=Anaeromyces robustus TaxID=1754192 RepID=A0A1Y1WYD4_9FUNG|nr:hypothetical protein BCR32DRAFT_282586 [Anaeromyces robustus]|eukprot:ORX78124.1 hypothetical protein BCR32DRAFT_282586 [Anaeromyces robustus]